MASILSKVRFLPLTIFAATLLLSIKVSDIWLALISDSDGLSIAQSIAQMADADTPLQPPAQSDGVNGDNARSNIGDNIGDERVADNGTAEGEGNETGDSPSFDIPSDIAEENADMLMEEGSVANEQSNRHPSLMTPEEIEILEHLAARRKELVVKQRQVTERIALLQAAELRVDEKINRLLSIQQTIETHLKSHTAEQDAKLAGIIKVYEGMKPKQAAAIFEDMEMDTLLPIVEGMSERKLSPVLAKMSPKNARLLTIALSNLRKLPDELSTNTGDINTPG